MPKLIYVADDEKNICFLIENFLEKEGYEVECFGDGEWEKHFFHTAL